MKETKNMDLKRWGFLIGIFALFFIIRSFVPAGLEQKQWDSLLVLFVVILMWLTEVVPMAISAVFILFFTAFMGVESEGAILSGFGTTGVFFLIAAMIIGQVFTKVGFGYRLSLYVLPLLGNKAKYVILSVMLGSGIISMFLANIPTSIIFLGLALPLIEKNGCEPGRSNFGKAILLGIAFASNIGGMGTPAGSGMNAVALNMLNKICGVSVSFVQWSVVGIPVAIILILIAWAILIKRYKPEMEIVKGMEDIRASRDQLTKLSGSELKFAIIFCVMVVMWFCTKITKIDMYIVTWFGIFIMSLPGMNLIDWKEINGKIDWSIMFMCGSVTALASVLSNLGTASWLGEKLGGLFFSGNASSLLVILLLVGALIIIGRYPVPDGLSLVAIALTIVGSVAVQIGVNPVVVCMPILLSPCIVFLIPIDPGALTTYSAGFWKFKEMMFNGLLVGLCFIPVCAVWVYIVSLTGILG